MSLETRFFIAVALLCSPALLSLILRWWRPARRTDGRRFRVRRNESSLTRRSW